MLLAVPVDDGCASSFTFLVGQWARFGFHVVNTFLHPFVAGIEVTGR